MVSAHGTDTTADDAPPSDGTADDWAVRMVAQMPEHTGSGSVGWVASHTGVPVDEMAQDMADDDSDGGTYGRGHC